MRGRRNEIAPTVRKFSVFGCLRSARRSARLNYGGRLITRTRVRMGAPGIEVHNEAGAIHAGAAASAAIVNSGAATPAAASNGRAKDIDPHHSMFAIYTGGPYASADGARVRTGAAVHRRDRRG